jgi:hypothetical protein
MREYQRRIDALLEEERERRKPPPPPISEEHTEMRNRIERAIGVLNEQIPEGTDVEQALAQSDDLANFAARIIVLMREEHAFLAGQGVDPRPYERY